MHKEQRPQLILYLTLHGISRLNRRSMSCYKMSESLFCFCMEYLTCPNHFVKSIIIFPNHFFSSNNSSLAFAIVKRLCNNQRFYNWLSGMIARSLAFLLLHHSSVDGVMIMKPADYQECYRPLDTESPDCWRMNL